MRFELIDIEFRKFRDIGMVLSGRRYTLRKKNVINVTPVVQLNRRKSGLVGRLTRGDNQATRGFWVEDSSRALGRHGPAFLELLLSSTHFL